MCQHHDLKNTHEARIQGLENELKKVKTKHSILVSEKATVDGLSDKLQQEKRDLSRRVSTLEATVKDRERLNVTLRHQIENLERRIASQDHQQTPARGGSLYPQVTTNTHQNNDSRRDTLHKFEDDDLQEAQNGEESHYTIDHADSESTVLD